jgi:arylsulfatase
VLGDDHTPEHYFLAADDGVDPRIVCPMIRDREISDSWGREVSPCWLVDGWTSPFTWGTWAMGPVSRAEVDLKTTSPRDLLIRARANRDLPDDRNQTVRVSVNGRDLGEKPVERKWTQLRYRIPEGVLHTGRNTISLRFAARISPSEVSDSKDYRTLAAGISQLNLTAPAGQSSGEAPDEAVFNVWDDDRESFVVGRAGIVIMPALIPRGTRSIDLDLHASLSIDAAKARAVFSIEDLDGASTRVREIEIPPGRSLSTARVPAEELSGRWVIASVETTFETGALEISRLRFTPEHRTESRDTSPTGSVAPESPPDIVLITLDAARADRFSFAGHTRETTPFIDELARESLVFPNAYALVPYTLCSVPTMITGLSFLDHGVVNHEDVLSEEAVTMAEALKHSGYQTACFSATPNNSRSKGFDQGYDVFREVWTEGEGRKENRRADFIADRVVEWLDTVDDDDGPLHLQVHMVPPHAPYDPAPAFDIFTDPSYDGPCDGFGRTIFAIDGGSMEPTRECLDHLLALYDGNLRAADDAVRTIVEKLKSRPRWKNTVVLVTSDHGEAFMDHGFMDHNSTVYTEMLRVPFVLRMPDGFEADHIDVDRLVTLADIAPTLLSAAGLRIPHTDDGLDLLTAGPEHDGRFMVSRTATYPPEMGIRTLRWSLMADEAGSGALFDLADDPGERINLRSVETARYVALGQILAARMRQPAELVVAAETADITDEERELLEVLGYIRD